MRVGDSLDGAASVVLFRLSPNRFALGRLLLPDGAVHPFPDAANPTATKERMFSVDNKAFGILFSVGSQKLANMFGEVGGAHTGTHLYADKVCLTLSRFLGFLIFLRTIFEGPRMEPLKKNEKKM